jgi:hypothetical protein
MAATPSAPDRHINMHTFAINDTFMGDLNKCGAIKADDNFLEGNLDHYVHPVFVREHWEPSHMSDSRWKQIKPAIHLASYFLARIPHLTSWWSKLLWGNEAH